MEVNMLTFLGFGLLVLMTILILVVKKQFDAVKEYIYSLYQDTVNRVDNTSAVAYTASIAFTLVKKPSKMLPDDVVEHPLIAIRYFDKTTQDVVTNTLPWEEGLAKISWNLQHDSNYCDPNQLLTLIKSYSAWLIQPIS